MLRAVAAITSASLLLVVPQQAAAQIGVRSTGAYNQAFEQVFLLHSGAVGRDFLVRVFAPPGASPSPSAPLPVIYALDEGYDIAGPAVRTLGGFMAPAFVVEIGYLPSDFRFRMTDVLFDEVQTSAGEEGGGGAAFETFLLNELRPWVEAHFPVDPTHSILMGHSAAAFFTAKVLVAKPDAFFGYIIASPSFQYEPGLVAKLGKTSSSIPVHVFISAGGDEKPEMIAGAKAASEALSRPGSGFIVHTEVFDGLGHGPSYLMLPLTAYPFLLPPDVPAGRK